MIVLTPMGRLKKRKRDLVALRQRINDELVLIDSKIRSVEDDERENRSRYTVPPCGTETAYQRHRYLASKGEDGTVWPLPPEDPCGCRRAHTQHQRKADAKKRMEGYAA